MKTNHRNVLVVSVWLLVCRANAGYAIDALSVSTEDDVVRVEGGVVAGAASATSGVRIFKGIPYAAAPTGNLRWQPPKQVVPWKGVRKAVMCWSIFGATRSPAHAVFTGPPEFEHETEETPT